MKLTEHPLIHTLVTLRGNPRSCVYTEPLWGIAYNLYAPYVSLYMRALGMTDAQIGLVISFGLVLQIFSALLGGMITDKMGRRDATLVFDLLAWTVPCLIWAVAQNFYFFIAAAVFNSLWRVTSNSWTCLMVEDAEPSLLVDIYTWVYISGLLSAFFAPLAGVFIKSYSLVPTMRGLYIFALILMTSKFFILYFFSTETQQGAVRMAETKTESIFSVLGGYKQVFGQIIRAPQTLYTIGLMIVIGISSMVNVTFWSLLVTERLQIPAQNIAFYPFARSIVMMIFFFLAMPRIREMNFKYPLLYGFGAYILGQLILITIPEKSYFLLFVSTFLEACSIATVGTLIDRMTIVTVDPKERARILSIIYALVILITSPFGWIAGLLSEISRILPFVLNIILFVMGAFLTYRASRYAAKHPNHDINIVAESV